MDNPLRNSIGDQAALASFPGSGSLAEWLDYGRGVLRRQYPVLLLAVFCTVALAFLYIYTTPSRFTAHAMLLIDTPKVRILQDSLVNDTPLDNPQVDTQVELLKSEGLALAVIKELKLTDDPEFVGRQGGFLGAIIEFFLDTLFSNSSTVGLASEDQLTRRAVGRFLLQRNVKRVTRTYILDVEFTSLSPGRAAAIANGLADAYIVDQLQAKYQATRRASTWLQERILELREQALAADRAVIEFKENKNIIGLGGSDGRLLAEQQVVDANTQLSQARAATAEAKARLDRIQQVMKEDLPDATVADQLRSEIINRLRTQYLELERRYNVWASRYGQNHLATLNLKTQMVELRRGMVDELSRLAESYKSDYEIAKAREESVQASLLGLVSSTQLTNRDRLGLVDLESRAKVYHTIHDSFLQRYMEATQQQSVPITEARIVTSAYPPGAASNVNLVKVLSLASIIGLALGGCAAAVREAVDRVFRTSRQVEALLKTNCLAALPLVKTLGLPTSPSNAVRRVIEERGLAHAKQFGPSIEPIFRHVLVDPLSSFAEGFRAIKVAADINAAIKENKVMGITSSVPNEGKSTVAGNFAQLIASGGSRVILVDGDLRNPTLSRKLAPKADVGLLQVLANKVSIQNALYVDEYSGLAFLPAAIDSRLAHSSEILASEAFRHLIDELRKGYDYVIIDFPPLAPVVDVRATTKVVDSYIFVVEWGGTRINFVQHQLSSAPEIGERLLGIVLNKANTKISSRYENYYGGYYYNKNYYARYGYTSD